MDNVNNNSYKIAGSALLGGGIGAIIGGIKAPSIVGKINADKFIQDSVYNAAIKDRFQKAGEQVSKEAAGIFKSCTDCFSSSQKAVEDIMLHGSQKALDIGTLRKSVINSPFLKDKNWSGDIIDNLKDFSDDVLIKRESIYELFTKTNPKYTPAKEKFNNFVNSLPKKTGKYAVIGAIAGAAIFALHKAYKLGKNQKSGN